MVPKFLSDYILPLLQYPGYSFILLENDVLFCVLWLGAARAAEEEVPADPCGPGAGVGAAVPALLVLGGLLPRSPRPP